MGGRGEDLAAAADEGTGRVYVFFVGKFPIFYCVNLVLFLHLLQNQQILLVFVGWFTFVCIFAQKRINRYPANVPEKKLKKKLKELLWDSRLSSYIIESIQEGVKPCIT